MLPSSTNVQPGEVVVAQELVALLHRLGFDAVIRDAQSIEIVASSPGAEAQLLAALPGDVRVATARISGAAIRVELVGPQMEKMGLTPRQAAVGQLLLEGMGNHEIARRLRISVHTVRRHVEMIFRRLGVNNRAAAVAEIKRLNRRH